MIFVEILYEWFHEKRCLLGILFLKKLVCKNVWFYVKNVMEKHEHFWRKILEHCMSKIEHWARTRNVMTRSFKCFKSRLVRNRGENENDFFWEMRNNIYEKWNENFWTMKRNEIWCDEIEMLVATSSSRRELWRNGIDAVVQRERHFRFAERTWMLGYACTTHGERTS